MDDQKKNIWDIKHGRLNPNIDKSNAPVSIDELLIYKKVVEYSNHGIAIISNNKIVFINNTLARLTGIASTANNVSATELAEFADVAYRKELESMLNAATANPASHLSLEFEHTNSDGQSQWYDILIIPSDYLGQPSLLAILVEISERRKAEMAMRENEQRLELAAKCIGLGTWDHNIKTGQVIRNKQWAEMLGYSADDIGGNVKNWSELIHPDDLPHVQEIARQHEAGETKEFIVEHRMKSSSGEWRWILNWGKAVEWDEKKHPVRVIGGHLDITPQKKLEDIREKNRAFFKQIIDAIPYETIIRDADAKIIFASKHCTKAKGFSDSDIIGISNLELWRKNKRTDAQIEEWLQEDQMVLSSGKPMQCIERLIYPGGLIKYYKTTKQRIIYPEGTPYVMVTYEDITELKTSEENIRKERDKAQQYLDIAETTLVAVDQHGQIILINKKGCELLGYSEGELIGKNWFDLIVPQEEMAVTERAFKSIINNEPEPYNYFENNVVTKSGAKRLVAWHNSYFRDDDNKITGCLSSGEDITDKRAAEEAIRESEEKYRVLFESGNDAILILRNNFIFDCNSEAMRMFACPKEDLVGKSLVNFAPVVQPDGGYSEGLIKEYIKTALGGKRQYYEFKHQRSEGDPFDAEISLNKIEFNSREYILAIIRDITDRKTTEMILLRSEETSRALMNAITESAVLFDLNGIVLAVNDTLCKRLGTSKRNIIGKDISQFFPDSAIELGNIYYQKVIENKKPIRFESSDNNSYLVNNFYPILNEHNEVEKIALFSYDITELRKAQLELQRSKATLESILRAAPIGIGLERRGALIWANEFFMKMTGYLKEEIAQENIGMFFDNDMEYQKIKELARKSGLGAIETKIKHKTKRLVNILLSLSSIATDGESGGTILTALDITKRKQSENLLRISHDLFSLAYKHNGAKGILDEAVKKIRGFIDCNAVGIRLVDENGHTFYFAHDGLCPDFSNTNRSSPANDDICAFFDSRDSVDVAQNRYFTAGGSFYVNSIPEYLANTNPYEKTKTCLVCSHLGHKSASIIPLRSGGKIIGVIYCADSHENKFPVKTVEMLEQIAMQFRIIIERVNAIEALKENEERFRNLVETMNDGLLIANEDKRFTYVNKKLADMMNRSQQELIGRDAYEVMDKRNRKILDAQWEFRKNGGNKPYEIELLKSDGSSVVTIISPTPLLDRKGIFKGSFSVITDITERTWREKLNHVKTQLADNLRRAEDIDDCLKYGCQAVINAELFKHTLFILKNIDGKITNVEHVGFGKKELTLLKNTIPMELENPQNIIDKARTISKSYIYRDDVILAMKASTISDNPINENRLDLGWKADEHLLVPIRHNIVDHSGWMITDTPFLNRPIDEAAAIFVEEVAETVAKRVNEMQIMNKLEKERQLLEDKNIALREVLASIEEEKMVIRRRVAEKVDQLVMPTLGKIINVDGTVNRAYLDLLADSVKNLAHTTESQITHYSKLSPREVDICNLIKSGCTSKEIAENLHLSIATVQKHRERIRNKLGLANKNVNLVSYLKNPH